MVGRATSTGHVQMQHTRCIPGTGTLALLKAGLPTRLVPRDVRAWRWRNLPRFLSGFVALLFAKLAMRATGIPITYGVLSLRKIQADGTMIDYGIVSFRKVTTAFVNYVATRLVDASTTIGNFDFHGYGTGTTAESNADTALVTEMTTQYATDNVRPTGTPTNPSANVYQSVATFSPDTGGTIAITEHGVFTQAATGGGTLMDRSVFSAVNLVAGSDSLQSTYQLTLAAEA